MQRLFEFDAYVRDPQVRREAWQLRQRHPAWTAAPNAGHRALVDLERSGRLLALVTQNIDGLHQRAGTTDDRVVEIHGTLWQTECLACGRRVPTSEILLRLDAGEPDPACTECSGILKVATISFGQALAADALDAALDAATNCSLFLAVGTSLGVQPAASLAELAARSGSRLVIVNAEPTPYDDVADAVLRDPIAVVLPRLVAGLRGIAS
jgi:NAD-dependent deacetylase